MMDAKILDRVQKLMAKAMDASCTEAEATAFLDKAKALMAEYGLSEEDVNAAKEEDFTFYDTEARNTKYGFAFHPVYRHCNSAVAKFCGCIGYIDTEKTPPEMRIFGLQSDVELARCILAGLAKTFDDNWRRYVYVEREVRGLLAAKEQRKAFTLGFASTLFKRLSPYFRDYQSPNGGVKTENALVVKKQDVARAELANRGVHLGKGPGVKWGAPDPHAAAAGAHAAKGANVGGAGVANRTLQIGSK